MRDQILANVRANQPSEQHPLPELNNFPLRTQDLQDQFMTVLSTIGGHAERVENYEEIAVFVKKQFSTGRIISSIPQLYSFTEPIAENTDPHELENVELAILSGEFGVAENAAIWVLEANYQERVAPFICQHLAIVLPVEAIFANMHQAYSRLQGRDYGFGVFIAGPSKTADIEQSLVLGAHGARTLTIFLLGPR